MNRIIYVIIALMALSQVALAQNEVEDMNAIKSNINYIYATGTSLVSNEEASQNAKDLLNAEIEDWLKKNAESDIAGYIAKSQEQLGMIKTKRGSLYRVFAYVHKADILPYYKDETVISGSFDNKTDTLIVELPKTDIVTVSQDTVQNIQLTAEDKLTIVEEPQYIPNDKENELLQVRTFLELNEYINIGRENGTISQLGKYSTLPKDGLLYVFIHNREGAIPACLKIDNGTTLNLATGKTDEITNYKGCGAIWIRFK